MRFPILVAAIFLVFGPGARADELTAKPLPGNNPCPYPPQAQKEYVAGPVHFVVQVRRDGTAEAVDVKKVPVSGIGFEETVRTCVLAWRFEPAPAGATRLREHDGRLRFRIDAAEEAKIRALLEDLAASWNGNDMGAVEALSLQADDTVSRHEARLTLQEQLQGEALETRWRMELSPDVEHVRFLNPELVAVRQPYHRQAIKGRAEHEAGDELAILDAVAVKGSRGWRLLRISPAQTAWLGAVRIGGTIREPRKVKDVPPRYPDIAKLAGVQGVVILECLITPEGKVANVRVLRGIPLLDEAALEAVRQWEYTPTLLDDVPVRVIMTVTVNFRLS
jgi:TonB family protein